MARFVVLGILVLAGCPGAGDGPPLPMPDRCDEGSPNDPSLESLELGTGDASLLFVPWSDGDSANLVYGPQGGQMLRLRLRVRGAPECLPQASLLRNAGGAPIASESTPVHAYDQGDGALVSGDIWLILDESATAAAGETITVETTLLAVTETRSLVIAF
jgi:hypothetical protein